MPALIKPLRVISAIVVVSGLLMTSAQMAAADGTANCSRILGSCQAAVSQAPTPQTSKDSGSTRGGSTDAAVPHSRGKPGADGAELARQMAEVEAGYQFIVKLRCGGANRSDACVDVLNPAYVPLTAPTGAGAPPAPAITPAQAGMVAVARLQLPVSAPGVGPDPDKNEWKMAAVGFPLWLWSDGATHVGPVADTVGGLSVSLDARVAKTVFDMGDGRKVRCVGAGTPYASWVQPGAESPNCGYRYEKASLPSAKYTVTATTFWTVTWTVNGQSGVIDVPRQGTVQLPVGELQTVIVR